MTRSVLNPKVKRKKFPFNVQLFTSLQDYVFPLQSLRYVKLTSMVSLGDLSFIFLDTKERPR